MSLFDFKGPVSYELPKASPCRICYWGGEGGGGAGRDDLINAQNMAIGNLQNYFMQARQDILPWLQTGGGGIPGQVGGALGKLAGAFGLTGIPGVTPTNLTSELSQWPGYQFLQGEATKGLSRYGQATGMGFSGPAMRTAGDVSQQLGLNYALTPWLNSMFGLSGQGLQAGGQSGNWAMQTGRGIADVSMQTGQQLARMDQMNQGGGWLNDLMGGLGFAGSLIAAPFTGGTSLIGAAGGLGSGLADMFGNASGGYMPAMESSLYGSPAYQAYGMGGGFGPSMPWKAEGGPTMAGRPYIVGERGPELFVPSRGGMVIPNHMLPPEEPWKPRGVRGWDYMDESGAFGGSAASPGSDMDFSDMIKFGAMINLMRPGMPGLMYSGEHGALQSPY